jgi:hypothetical protein
VTRQKPDWCGPRQAAKRLGISVDEVLDLISTGELPAVTFMDDNRVAVDLDSLDRMARKARRQEDAPPDGGVRGRADLSQVLSRCLGIIFQSRENTAPSAGPKADRGRVTPQNRHASHHLCVWAKSPKRRPVAEEARCPHGWRAASLPLVYDIDGR